MHRWLILLLFGCGKDVPSVPPEADVWARTILALPVDEVCGGVIQADFFCAVRPSLITDAVRSVGARSITLQSVRGDRYINFDWGGGHVEAYGVLIGPTGWAHQADLEFRERRIRDGVFSYDKRQ